jgi:hypothetical protein
MRMIVFADHGWVMPVSIVGYSAYNVSSYAEGKQFIQGFSV